ncbi:MAG: hypothetical protein F4Y01_04580 [Gammaproteobacteria bacterium]|nr:hypothetical protein [Gammaproteobacteria bacterium]
MIAYVLSADWGKAAGKRAVYVAEVGARSIGRCKPPTGGWTAKALLRVAEGLSRHGAVLVGVDVVLGLPDGYWHSARKDGGRLSATFVEWLAALRPSGGFFRESRTAEEWMPERPWFRVPPGQGGLSRYKARVPGGMLRRIDRATAGKPVFAVSGFPGSVGSGTRTFWQELGPLLARERDFTVWPFEGAAASPGADGGVVLCETYPRLAYAGALADELPASALAWPKSKAAARAEGCERLVRAGWIDGHGVRLDHLECARANEDDFDALFTAAAVLRCVVERRALVSSEWVDEVAEGGMLLAGPVRPGAGRRPRRVQSKAASATMHVCPISGCSKVFRGSRAGWDKHIERPAAHPDWRADVADPAERRRLFREDFADWLA